LGNYLKNKISSAITKLWWHLPLGRQQKEILKRRLFILFPFIFRNTKVYKNWHDANLLTDDHDLTFTHISKGFSQSEPDKEFCFEPQLEHSNNLKPVGSLAIIIHVFYPEILDEIINYLTKWKKEDFQIYLTTPHDKLAKLNELNKNSILKTNIHAVDNHGRDILPFLKILPGVLDDGHDIILKLHTKKSDHRQTGDLWRRDVFKKLLSESSNQQVIDIFNSNGSVGIIGPSGHIVPMSLYYGANAKKIRHLSQRMNVQPQIVNSLSFVAGSMFYARKEAFKPLIDIELNEDDFEAEASQNDGTMAHAVERAFAISSYAAGFMIADTNYSSSKSSPVLTKDHPFTW